MATEIIAEPPQDNLETPLISHIETVVEQNNDNIKPRLWCRSFCERMRRINSDFAKIPIYWCAPCHRFNFEGPSTKNDPTSQDNY